MLAFAITGWSLAALFAFLFYALLWTWKRVDAVFPGRTLESLWQEYDGMTLGRKLWDWDTSKRDPEK